jgi:hypothetical protein
MDGSDHSSIRLVNICAPADAPRGAPLLFDPTAPGHCVWGSASQAQAISYADQTLATAATDARVVALEAEVARLREIQMAMLDAIQAAAETRS